MNTLTNFKIPHLSMWEDLPGQPGLLLRDALLSSEAFRLLQQATAVLGVAYGGVVRAFELDRPTIPGSGTKQNALSEPRLKWFLLCLPIWKETRPLFVSSSRSKVYKPIGVLATLIYIYIYNIYERMSMS